MCPANLFKKLNYNHSIWLKGFCINFNITRWDFCDKGVATRMLQILEDPAVCSYICLSLHNAGTTLLLPRGFGIPWTWTKEFTLSGAEWRAFNSIVHPSKLWLYESHTTWLVSCEGRNMTLVNSHQHPTFSSECFQCITHCSLMDKDKSCKSWLVEGMKYCVQDNMVLEETFEDGPWADDSKRPWSMQWSSIAAT